MRKFIFALLLLLILGTAPVFACLPPTPNADGSNIWTLEDEVWAAGVILIGTVVSADEESPYGIVYGGRIEEIRYLKGTGPEVVSFELIGSDCSPTVRLGDNLIFFGFWTPEHSFRVTWTRPLDDEAEIVAITNTPNARQTIPGSEDIYIGASIFVLAASSFGTFWYLRRNRRKSKAKREELI